jgi:ABC-type proline/glycine betaine transport system permease subunit
LRADIYRFGLKDPSDVSGLREAIEKGVIDPGKIVGVIGKTHGNGLVNDYTRGYLTLCLSHLIGDRLGVPAESVSKRIPFIFSGGVEGVLSPHYTVFTVDPIGAATGQEKSLAIGVAFTPELSVSDVGRQRQIEATAEAVRQAMASAGIESPDDVHFVQVKGPAFTLVEIVAATNAGLTCATDNPGKLMGFGRAASALGVAKALGEVPASQAQEAAVLHDFSAFSSVIPLFNLWFGADTSGIILFVAYGVAVIMFIGTVNAVRNVPRVYFDRAATVGASRAAIFRHVILPAIFPEIRASFLLSFGLSWSLVVAGELLGAQSGLGVIVTYALQFAYTGRVMIVAFLFIIYAGLSFALFDAVSRRIIDWHPQVDKRPQG